MISREEAVKVVESHVGNENLVNHMKAVGAIMGCLAEHLGEDRGLWEAVGILHDVDYEETSEDFSKHGLRSAEIVEDLLPEEGLEAIRRHNPSTGHEPETKMDIALFAADAISGMIVANALVRPKKLSGMKPGSIRRRMNDKSFARQISRENIMRCEEIGISFNEFARLSVEAMQGIAEEIDLT